MEAYTNQIAKIAAGEGRGFEAAHTHRIAVLTLGLTIHVLWLLCLILQIAPQSPADRKVLERPVARNLVRRIPSAAEDEAGTINDNQVTWVRRFSGVDGTAAHTAVSRLGPKAVETREAWTTEPASPATPNRRPVVSTLSPSSAHGRHVDSSMHRALAVASPVRTMQRQDTDDSDTSSVRWHTARLGSAASIPNSPASASSRLGSSDPREAKIQALFGNITVSTPNEVLAAGQRTPRVARSQQRASLPRRRSMSVDTNHATPHAQWSAANGHYSPHSNNMAASSRRSRLARMSSSESDGGAVITMPSADTSSDYVGAGTADIAPGRAPFGRRVHHLDESEEDPVSSLFADTSLVGYRHQPDPVEELFGRSAVASPLHSAMDSPARRGGGELVETDWSDDEVAGDF